MGKRRVCTASFYVCLSLVCCLGRAQPKGRVGDAAGRSRTETQAALTWALKGTDASAAVVRVSDGVLLAAVGKEQAATPGSAIKPLLLSWALQHGVIQASTAVYCRRSLRVGGRLLACTHPRDQRVFTAQSALAESCNTYFAALGLRLRGDELEAALRASHLPHADATHDTPEQRELTVLGLRGVTATPLELARAYRDLSIKEDPHGVVVRGLVDAVQFGMADPARVEGVELLGKTGTASDDTGHWTHGWFAGGLPGRMMLVIYVPHGGGGVAAGLAGAFFRAVMASSR